MIPVAPASDASGRTGPESEELLQSIKSRFQAANHVRRGVCLLNAGQFDAAAAAFARAAQHGSTDGSLPSYLAACLVGQGKPAEAAEQLARVAYKNEADTAAVVRCALALSSAGRQDEALRSLRDGIHNSPECAELHFQLGTLLTELEQYDEAELRFTQVLSIDRGHTEALVNLALCRGLRGAPTEALSYLQRAQARRPHDARIGLLLSQAAKAVQQRGLTVRVRAQVEADPCADTKGIEELSNVIGSDPDFVDAFLSIPVGQVDEQFFAMLLKTLEKALERQPEHAELHFHCGRVLERLGRREDAIGENERAVRIDPTCTRALIELGRLYRQTDRDADAATRLEQAIAAGAEYADVYLLLGNLYRDRGQIGRARNAYRRALTLNDRFEAAQKALASLPG